MADGTITIDTKLDTTKLKNDLKKTELRIESQTAKVKELESAYKAWQKTASAQQENFGSVSDVTTQNVERARIAYEQSAAQLESMQIRADGLRERIEGAEEPAKNLPSAFEGASKSLDKFSKRIGTMAKKVFVFTVILRALRSFKEYLGNALNTNEGFTRSLAQLKGTLLTAFQPILEFVIPILQAFVNILTRAFALIAKFTSWLGGTTVEASSDAAKALYDQANATAAAGDAAEKAKKQMSGLDEMNTWQADKDSGGGGAGGSAVKPDFRLGVEDEMSALEVYISGALLALGAILTFTGASPAIGIALMAVGAAGLASALSMDWETMPDNIKTAVTEVMLILGAAALAIGAIMAFTGANIPLGIGLMLAGAASLGTAAALNWGSLVQALQGPVGTIMAIIGGALLVLGVILLFTGAGIPLGLGMIVAGAASLAAPIAANWDAIVKWVKGIWAKIKAAIQSAVDWFVSAWQSIGDFFKGIWDGIKNVFQTAVDWIKENWQALLLFMISPVAGIFKYLYDNFEGFRNFVDNVIGKVKGFFTGLWDGVKNGASNAWEGVKNVFSTVAEFFGNIFKNAWQKVKNVFSTGGKIFDGIKDGIVSAFKTVVNAIITGINKVVKLPFEGLNSVLDGIQNAKIAGIKPFNWITWRAPIPQIPMLAQGAVIPANNAFLAVLGDQKHGNNIEAPEDLIRQIVREESGKNGNYTFVAELDGRVLFKEVISAGKLQRQTTGKNPFKLGAY